MKKLIWILLATLFLWFSLTLFMEQAQKDFVSHVGGPCRTHAAIILFRSVPFYHLDKRVAPRSGMDLAALNGTTGILGDETIADKSCLEIIPVRRRPGLWKWLNNARIHVKIVTLMLNKLVPFDGYMPLYCTT